MLDSILILDFGSQYTQLIARRIREMEVYSEIRPFSSVPEDLSAYKGIILSGSPFSVKDENALQVDLSAFIGKLPVLGICYGAQYIANSLGGKVEKSDKREYGKAALALCTNNNPLFKGVNADSQVWMSHGDSISDLPKGFELLANTNDIPIAAFGSTASRYEHPVFCLQFHPEVTHSVEGFKMLENFVRHIARCEGKWTPAAL